MVCDCKQQSQQTPFLHPPPFPIQRLQLQWTLHCISLPLFSLSLSLCVVSAAAMWIWWDSIRYSTVCDCNIPHYYSVHMFLFSVFWIYEKSWVVMKEWMNEMKWMNEWCWLLLLWHSVTRLFVGIFYLQWIPSLIWCFLPLHVLFFINLWIRYLVCWMRQHFVNQVEGPRESISSCVVLYVALIFIGRIPLVLGVHCNWVCFFPPHYVIYIFCEFESDFCRHSHADG